MSVQASTSNHSSKYICVHMTQLTCWQTLHIIVRLLRYSTSQTMVYSLLCNSEKPMQSRGRNSNINKFMSFFGAKFNQKFPTYSNGTAIRQLPKFKQNYFISSIADHDPICPHRTSQTDFAVFSRVFVSE